MAGKLMHACVYDGSVSGVVGLKHVQVPVPTPSKDEVLIKLEATSLNPFDWKAYKLKALLRPLVASNSPLIPGTDVAGEVVGLDPESKRGGLSEYGVANEKLTVSRPPEVSAAEGSGLPIAGLTAHMALTQYAGLNLDGTGPQKNILVTAASGGVGLYAVQLAKLGGAHVTATCGARNIDLVKSLGADDVLDYKTPDGAALKSPSGRKYDAVVHCATGVSWSVFEPNLSDKGVVIDLTPGAAAMWTCVVNKVTCSGKRLAPLMLIPKDDRSLLCLVELVKERKLKTIIDSRHRLGRAEEAWSKCIDGHATGKIIVEL
ncbi:UNVERIFIED_CONTAM: Quinone-oxidoreductase QR1, chloroplastic [Sesamum radiatum]|uniref:Quinone-oxidoreductase QR1, chloroplastic n=1 Tax=Sesamum radiatum TaxID=300843 RepID=A0AAW2UMD9_SESRA